MNSVRFPLILAFLVLVTSSAPAQQSVTKLDRVICGNANLSTGSKSGKANVQAEALRKVLMNAKVHVIIVQERIIVSGTDEEKRTEYWILYALGRETRFRELVISQEDYLWLIKLANELHAEG